MDYKTRFSILLLLVLNALFQSYCHAKSIKIADTKDSVVIENDFFILTISKTEKGAIEQIVNKITSRKLLADDLKGRSLYRIKAMNFMGENAAEITEKVNNWGYVRGGSVDRGNIEIAGTSDPYIYQTERYGTKGYNFEIPNGKYAVKMHFAETYGGNIAKITVMIEGKKVLENFNCMEEAGMKKAVIKSFDDLEVTDGKLSIELFVPGKNGRRSVGGFVNGIEIVGAGTELRVNCAADKEYKDSLGRIWLPDQAYEKLKRNYISSADAKETSVKTNKKGNNVVLTITNKQHTDNDITVIAECLIKPDSPLLYWTAKINNNTGLWVKEMEFPVLICNQIGEKSEDDYILESYCDGGLILNPLKNLAVKEKFPYSGNYPGGLSAQLMSFQDDEGGLYYGVHDGNGYTKGMFSYRILDGINMTAVHLFPHEYGNDYSIPYDTVLGVFKGDWYHAADIYKEWAIKQKWCSKKIVERKDIPNWLKKGVPVFGGSSVEEDVDRYMMCLSDYLHKYVDRQWLIHLDNWERYGLWIAPQYFPPKGGERFRKGMKELNKRGDITGVYLTGLRWTVEKEVDKYKDQAGFEEKGKPYAIIGENDEIIYEYNGGLGKRAEMCAATDFTYKMLQGIMDECQDYGISLAHLDQLVGGGQPICYSKTHNHKPGPGNYQSVSLNKMFSKILKRGLKRDANFAISLEEPGELYIQSMNSYFSRDEAQAQWPRAGLHNLGVPVFTYLYHEYLPAYPTGARITSNNRERILTYGLYIVNGLPPIAYLASVLDPARVFDKARKPDVPKEKNIYKTALYRYLGLTDEQAEQKAFEEEKLAVRNTVEIFNDRTCKYLRMGKMMHPFNLNVAKETFVFNMDGQQKKELEFPVILHSVFESVDKKGIGAVFFNWTDKEITFDVPLFTYASKVKKYNVFKCGKDSDMNKPILNGVSLSTVTLTLGPSEAAFIEIITKE